MHVGALGERRLVQHDDDPVVGIAVLLHSGAEEFLVARPVRVIRIQADEQDVVLFVVVVLNVFFLVGVREEGLVELHRAVGLVVTRDGGQWQARDLRSLEERAVLIKGGAPTFDLVADGDKHGCIGNIGKSGIDGLHPHLLLLVNLRVNADLRVAEEKEVPVAVAVIGGKRVLGAPACFVGADLVGVLGAGLQPGHRGGARLGEDLRTGRDRSVDKLRGRTGDLDLFGAGADRLPVDDHLGAVRAGLENNRILRARCRLPHGWRSDGSLGLSDHKSAGQRQGHSAD